MQAIVAATSWDNSADQMAAIIQQALRDTRPPARQSPQAAPSDATAVPTRTAEPPPAVTLVPHARQAHLTTVPCVILGAGPTGLSAAYHYGAGSLLLERNRDVGGWYRSIEDNGFTFDYAGHIMFSQDPYVLALYEKLLGDNMHWQDREAWIYSQGVYSRYPFQGALYGLPPTVIKECLLGAIAARFPNAGAAPAVRAERAQPDGLSTQALASPAPGNFEQFIRQVWGEGIGKHFALPYNQKLWTVPLTKMETSWLGGRVPLPDLEQIISGALEPVGPPQGPNARFSYPVKGGFQALMTGFVPHLQGELETGAEVVSLQPDAHLLTLADGRRYRYEHLISTMPLPALIAMMGDAAPDAVRAAAQGLRHISVRCVNLGIGRPALTDKHWIYYPGDTLFHRIFVQGNASPHNNAPGGFALTCELTYSSYKPLPLEGQALIDRCISDCIRVGLFRADDEILTVNMVDMPYAYVLYDHARAGHFASVRQWLARYDILLAGRYSEWEYYNSDHAFIAGKKAAEAVKALAPKIGLVR